MAEPKTKPTAKSVAAFLEAVADEGVRRDCRTLVEIMQTATGAPPAMWGPSIVGFGSYRYTYASGRTADWPLTGFSPRKPKLVLYIMAGFEKYEDLVAKLGPHTRGASCLYVKRLSDLHRPTLEKLVRASVAQMRKTNGAPEKKPAEPPKPAPFAARLRELKKEFGDASRFEAACAYLDLHLEWAKAAESAKPPDFETAERELRFAASCQATIGTFATGSGEGLESMAELYAIMKRRAAVLMRWAKSSEDRRAARARLEAAREIWKEIAADPNGFGRGTRVAKALAETDTRLAELRR